MELMSSLSPQPLPLPSLRMITHFRSVAPGWIEHVQRRTKKTITKFEVKHCATTSAAVSVAQHLITKIIYNLWFHGLLRYTATRIPNGNWFYADTKGHSRAQIFVIVPNIFAHPSTAPTSTPQKNHVLQLNFWLFPPDYYAEVQTI